MEAGRPAFHNDGLLPGGNKRRAAGVSPTALWVAQSSVGKDQAARTAFGSTMS